MLRNITFSAEESAIAAARTLAKQENTTLNAVFREWLEEYTKKKQDKERKARVRAFRELMKKLSYVEPGRKFTREEMNER